LLDRAYAEDRILVTLNVGNFEALVRKRELHALINEVLRVAEDAWFTRPGTHCMSRNMRRTLHIHRDSIHQLGRRNTDLLL
jgi:hypothetical protein